MAAQSAEEGRGTFDRLPLEVDPELSEDLSAPLDGRQVKPRTRLRLALGGLLAGAAVLAVGFTLKQRTFKTADVSALQEEDEVGIKPFHKCGGANYHGRTCCRSGCACIIQSQYYSECQAPGGGQTCNVEKAKGEVMSAKETALEARPAALEAIKAAKKAMRAELLAKKNLQAAREMYDTATKEGEAVRNAKDQQERLVKDAQNEADKAKKASEDKLKHWSDVKKEIEDMNKTAALRVHGQCGALFDNCGQVTKYKACCQPGCTCKWRDAYYAQCQSPYGGGCNPAHEEKYVKERKALMAKLQEEHEALEENRNKTKAYAEKVDEEATDIRHKAAEAGTKKEHAHRIMMRKKAIAESLTAEAKRLKQSALHKKHAVHYAALAIKAWKEAAKGHKCGGDDADVDADTTTAAAANTTTAAAAAADADADADADVDADADEDEDED